jgi:predicted transcriptional regulator
MIVKGKYEYNYSAISIRHDVAVLFRVFSKKISKSHTNTLVIIMDFFKWHGFNPSERFTKSILEEILKNRKRTEANIAIMRNIEKNQTEPTTIMLQSLFEEKLTEEEPEMFEKKFIDKPPEEKKEIKITVPKIRYEQLHSKLISVKSDFQYVLENVNLVKSNFGKNYFKLELTEGELEKFKRILKNIG